MRYFKIRNILAFCLLTAVSSQLQAEDRILATHGDEIEFSMDAAYQCSSEAVIKINTARADNFEQDDGAIQNWSDVIKDILGFECGGQVETFVFKGYTKGVEIFSADTNATVNWAIQSDPAPLEKYALFFNLKEPTLFNLGALYGLYKPFDSVPSIKKTIQYEILRQQLLRMGTAVNGDLNEFKTYLSSAGPGVPNFDFIKSHHDLLMEAIQAFKPEHYDNYLLTYLTNLQNLKNEFWAAQASEIIDDYSLSLTELFSKATEKAKLSESEEFAKFLDKQLVEVVNDEFAVLREHLGNATLLEINYTADFLADTPDSEATQLFPGSSALLGIYPDETLALINARIGELFNLAIQTINESGEGYIDTDQVMETGFALAGEFDESGFANESEQLVLHTIGKVNSLLDADLPQFTQEIAELQLDDEVASELQNQSDIYEELGSQFDGFKIYQSVVDQKLIDDRHQICESLLSNASVEEKNFEQTVRIFDEDRSLLQIACELYDNGNTLVRFDNSWFSKRATFVVVQDNDEESTFIASSEQSDGAYLVPILATVASNDINDADQAQEELLRLVQPQPDGTPDTQGIRQCDRMAGDPEDPSKLATGMDFDDQNLDPRDFDRAIDACIAAVENDPNDSRSQYQLGRILFFAGDDETASEYFNLSAEQNYAPALHFKAEMLLSSSESQNDFVDALTWFETAGKAGYQPAATMLKELNPTGEKFYKELPPPTGDDIVSAMPNVGGSQTIFGTTTTVRLVDAEVRSCFQTSATDFSCEFRKILRCSISSSFGGGFAANLMSNALRADCNSVPYEFGDFRIQNGKWYKV